jgi:hypothetical protein
VDLHHKYLLFLDQQLLLLLLMMMMTATATTRMMMLMMMQVLICWHCSSESIASHRSPAHPGCSINFASLFSSHYSI